MGFWNEKLILYTKAKDIIKDKDRILLNKEKKTIFKGHLIIKTKT